MRPLQSLIVKIFNSMRDKMHDFFGNLASTGCAICFRRFSQFLNTIKTSENIWRPLYKAWKTTILARQPKMSCCLDCHYNKILLFMESVELSRREHPLTDEGGNAILFPSLQNQAI